MTDHHHDFGDHHEDDYPIFEEPHADHYEQPSLEDHALFEADDTPAPEHPVFEHHDDTPYEEPLVDDHAALTDVAPAEDPVDVFPPAVDVGELPEPVDGFPWIDTGSLGVVHAEALEDTTQPVRPEELAEYAGVDLPEAQDPWAALAESDDPATSTLAKWWSQN